MAERELKQQNGLEHGGPSGLETLRAWRPFGPGDTSSLETLWAWRHFEPGDPLGLEAL